MPSRFAQYGGAAGADQMLQQIIAEKLAAEQRQQAMAQQETENQQRNRALGQGDQRIGLEQQQIDLARQPKAPGPMTLGAGASLVDPATGRILTTAPTTPPAPRGPMALSPGSRLIDPATGRLIASAPTAAPQPRDERLVQVMGPDGTPIWTKESQAAGKPAAQAPRAVTGAERQTLSYYNRAKQATEDITPLEEQIAKSGLGTQLQMQYAPNMLQNQTQQSYRQAQRSFTEARLRKESGAAIPTAEYENDARTYFAQPGDSPATLEQKRRARAVVLEGMRNSAGRAYEEFYGPDGQPKAAPPSSGVSIKAIRQVK